MSNESAFTIPINHRVRLKDDRAEVYPRAFAGSEGWIRKQQTDPVGDYAMVYIEWDKEHWSYNGENNCWTFEDHFEPVIEKTQVQRNREEELRNQKEEQKGEQKSDEPDKPSRLPTSTPAARDFVDRITEDMKREDEGRLSKDDEYIEIISAAMDAASESDAFFCIAVRREKVPSLDGELVLIPMVFGDARTPEAELLIDAQLSDIASTAHKAMVIREVQRILQAKQQHPDED